MRLFMAILTFFVSTAAFGGQINFPGSRRVHASLENTPEFLIESTLALFDLREGFANGKYCSGVVVRYRGKHYAFTNAHCTDNHSCSTIGFARGYTAAKLADAVLKTGIVEEFRKKHSVPANLDVTFLEVVPLFVQNGRQIVDDYLVSSGKVITSTCEKVVLENKDLDISVLELSDPTNSSHKNSQLPAVGLTQVASGWNSGFEEVFTLSYPFGMVLQRSDQCEKGSAQMSTVPFSFKYNCNIGSGSSGGPIFRTSGNILLGLNRAIPKGEVDVGGGIMDERTEWPREITPDSESARSVNLQAIAPVVREFLDGKNPGGFIDLKEKVWFSLKSEAKMIHSGSLNPLTDREKSEIAKSGNSFLSFEGAVLLIQQELATGSKLNSQAFFQYTDTSSTNFEMPGLIIGVRGKAPAIESIRQKLDLYRN